jgi:hypothetical protein
MPPPDDLLFFAARLEAVGAPYMITGATAAIMYGQPRVTNDLDVVINLSDAARVTLLEAFPESEFYVPPESVIRTEQARNQRGHFNLIHHGSGFKADLYLTGNDPLHGWALPLRRRLPWLDGRLIPVAPPEYVVLRKLEFYREGRSSKHLTDIRMIREITGVDEAEMSPWLKRMNLEELWQEFKSS